MARRRTRNVNPVQRAPELDVGLIVQIATLQSVNNLSQRIGAVMDQLAKLRQDIAELDEATNEVARVLETTRGAIRPGMNDAEVEAVGAEIDRVTMRLRALATEPTNPVPGGPADIDNAEPVPLPVATDEPAPAAGGTPDTQPGPGPVAAPAVGGTPGANTGSGAVNTNGVETATPGDAGTAPASAVVPGAANAPRGPNIRG